MIPRGILRLDAVLAAEADAAAQAYHTADTSRPCHHRGGLVYIVRGRTWANETPDYRRERIATQEALLRDLTRRAAMDAAVHRLGAEIDVDTTQGAWWVRVENGWALHVPDRDWIWFQFGSAPLGPGKVNDTMYGVLAADTDDAAVALATVLASVFALEPT